MLNSNPKVAFGFMNKEKFIDSLMETSSTLLSLLYPMNHCCTKKNGIWVCR